MTWPPAPQPPDTDTCAHCGLPLDDSPSDFWCSAPCQMLWQSKGANTRILPRRTARDTPPPVPPASWPTIAIPHPAGGVTYARSEEEYQRYIAADPAPVEPPPEPVSPFGITEFGEYKPPPRPGFIDRILNATRRTT